MKEVMPDETCAGTTWNVLTLAEGRHIKTRENTPGTKIILALVDRGDFVQLAMTPAKARELSAKLLDHAQYIEALARE